MLACSWALTLKAETGFWSLEAGLIFRLLNLLCRAAPLSHYLKSLHTGEMRQRQFLGMLLPAHKEMHYHFNLFPNTHINLFHVFQISSDENITR